MEDPFADVPAEPDTVPIAEVVLEDGRALGWYENQGHFFRVSRGTNNGLPTIAHEFPELRELSPTEQWTFLSGGPVPPELEEYEQRLGAAQPMPANEHAANTCEGGSTQASVPGDHPQNRSNPCQAQWWVDNFCNLGFEHQFCKIDHWNGAYHSINNVEWYLSGVCGVIGDVSFRVLRNGSQVFTIGTVPPNHYYYYEWYATCYFGFLVVDCSDAYYSQVYNASNNKFHFYTGAFR